ncbi:hypothetical protein L6452_32994 [Arctium lappa]|uniref:Uncharacterized protein n=1 Tax=Arctium lappa TaxID=4217 RepID=A0ACB8Z6C6_ARCLA|nr:hypothetical protein L6452_32994 [Arctium lappa]
MFKERLGDTMEVYIDDMLVKSIQVVDHVEHLRQSFDILRKYHMKLNLTKCSFGVNAGKFLGYMVTRRGIEANHDQIKAIIEIKSPRNFKEVQRLTGRLAKWSIYLHIYDIDFKPRTAITKSQIMTDFVADFIPELEKEAQDETYSVETLDDKPWTLHVDGLSNARGTGLAVVFKSQQGARWVAREERLPPSYEPNEWRVLERDSKMTAYLKIAKAKSENFKPFSIEQILRDHNTQANTLANLGSSLSKPLFDIIPMIHLSTLSVDHDDIVQIDNEEEGWSNDIMNYLVHDQLPEDKASRYVVI